MADTYWSLCSGSFDVLFSEICSLKTFVCLFAVGVRLGGSRGGNLSACVLFSMIPLFMLFFDFLPLFQSQTLELLNSVLGRAERKGQCVPSCLWRNQLLSWEWRVAKKIKRSLQKAL